MHIIVVTGGAGFIGSAVVRYLIKNTSYRVVNIDTLTYAANLESLKDVYNNNRYVFKRVDICDRGSVRNIFTVYEHDFIMNLVAESHVYRSIDRPGDFITTNIVGTYTLLEEAMFTGKNYLKLKRYVNVPSCINR